MKKKIITAAIADIDTYVEYLSSNELPTSIILSNYDYKSMSIEDRELLKENYTISKVDDHVRELTHCAFSSVKKRDQMDYPYFKCPGGNMYPILDFPINKDDQGKNNPGIVIESFLKEDPNNFKNATVDESVLHNKFYKEKDIVERMDRDEIINNVRERSKLNSNKNTAQGR